MRLRTAILVAGLLAASFAAYAATTRAGFIFDDDTLLADNPLMRDPAGVWRFWVPQPSENTPDYWPLTSTTLWLEYRLWGLDRPWGYHLTNVLLHAVGALLLWRVLRRLGAPAAYAAAMVFAVHPLCAASVAWISERKNVLSMVFYALAVLAYLRFDESRRPRWYALAVAAFAAALLSKTSGILLPLALPVLLWRRKGRIGWRDLAPALPLLALSAAAGFATLLFQHQMPMGVEHSEPYSFAQRLAGAGTAVWFYLYKALVPLRLSLIYPRWEIDSASPAWWLGWAGIAAAAAILFRKRRTPWGGALLAAGTYYLLVLLPALGLVRMRWMVYSLVADHFQYLALPAVVATVVGGAWITARRYGTKPAWAAAAGAVLIAALGTLTVIRAGAYRDLHSLWQDVTDKYPGIYLGHHNLGNILAEQGRTDEALAAFRRAVDLKGDSASAHYSLGRALLNAGKPVEAEAHCRLAIDLRARYAARHPELSLKSIYPEAENNLGMVLMQTGRPAEAVSHFVRALEGDPEHFEARNNLGMGLIRMEQYGDAIRQLTASIELRPDSVEANFNLGLAFDRAGQADQALAQYARTLRIAPGHFESLNNTGILLAKGNRPAESIPYFQRALKVRPDSVDALNNLGLSLQRMGRPREAVTCYLQALSIQGDNVSALFNLGTTMLDLGRLGEAIDCFRRVLAVQPGQPDALQLLAAATNDLARTLAADPRPEVRNAAEAVRLAEESCRLTGRQAPVPLDTLAAAYAEAGRFDDAVAASREAIDAATRTGQTALLEAFRDRLKLYESRRPFRLPSRPATQPAQPASQPEAGP